MSIIDRILDELEKRAEYCGDWQVEITASAKEDETSAITSFSWDAESYMAARVIKDYLIAKGMTDGKLIEPQGSFVRISKRNQDNS
ncbi:MAG: hypothetical protein PHR77_09420 [Kiritimatiellae bacterium]|nr:hypothetical protein [Kiritimatiellia bacterium]MDD5522957.1 hypothetical protein [Kiritimatiellia bacterium]